MAFSVDEVLQMDQAVKGGGQKTGFNVDDVLAMDKSGQAPQQSGLQFLLSKAGIDPSRFDSIKKAASGFGQFMSGDLPPTADPELRQMSGILQKSPPMQALGMIAGAGRAVNSATQNALGGAADMMGRAGVPPTIAAGIATVPATLAQAVLPQDKVSALMSIAGAGSASEIPEAAAATKARAMGEAPVLKSGPGAKVSGGLMTTTSAIPLKYSQAIASDPSILTDATPTTAELQTMYDSYFKSKGMKFDSDLYEQVFGNRYPPRDAQISKLESVVQDTIKKVGSKTPPSQEELVLAKRAAGKLQESENALRNPSAMRLYSQDESTLGSELSKSGDNTLQSLDRMYFRSKAREAANQLLPQNKNMSPNVLRGLYMLEMAKKSLLSFGQGNIAQGVAEAGGAAMVSPAVSSRVLSGPSPQMSLLGQAVGMGAGPQSLEQMGPQQ